MNRDEENLRLLAVFHYVVAAIAALMSLFPIFHLIFGLFFVYEANHYHGQGQGQPPTAFVGWLFVFMAIVFIVIGLTFSILVLINGLCLAKRRHYTFCQVMSGIECLLMPFGTILGVFTLVILSRESVRQLFGVGAPPPRANHP